MALSRLKHGFESRWGRHFILRAPNCGQVLERVGRYGSSNKLFSVERYILGGQPEHAHLAQLTYADDHPGNHIPALRFAFEVTR